MIPGCILPFFAVYEDREVYEFIVISNYLVSST